MSNDISPEVPFPGWERIEIIFIRPVVLCILVFTDVARVIHEEQTKSKCILSILEYFKIQQDTYKEISEIHSPTKRY